MESFATNVAIDELIDVGADGTAEVTGAGQRHGFRRRDAPTAFPQIAAEGKREGDKDRHLMMR